MIEIQDANGVTRLLKVAAIVEVSPTPGDSQSTRIVLRNGAVYDLATPYETFRTRLIFANQVLL